MRQTKPMSDFASGDRGLLGGACGDAEPLAEAASLAGAAKAESAPWLTAALGNKAMLRMEFAILPTCASNALQPEAATPTLS